MLIFIDEEKTESVSITVNRTWVMGHKVRILLEPLTYIVFMRYICLGHHNKYHCFSGNRTCQFPPTRQFFNNGHATVCSPSMYIYLRSQCLMSTFVVIRLFRSVSGCPYGKEGLVSGEICNSPWLVNQLATVERVHTTRRKQCWFCLFLPHFFWCVSASSGPYHIVFKPDFLPTDDFFKWQVSCVSPTHPFPWQLQRRLDIGYEYWKWSALRYIMHGSVYPFWFRVNSALDERLLSLVDLDLFFLCSNHAM